MDIVWIIIPDVFEGTVEHWKDCFFANPSKSNVIEFAEKEFGETPVFLDKVPAEFAAQYEGKTLTRLSDNDNAVWW